MHCGKHVHGELTIAGLFLRGEVREMSENIWIALTLFDKRLESDIKARHIGLSQVAKRNFRSRSLISLAEKFKVAAIEVILE